MQHWRDNIWPWQLIRTRYVSRGLVWRQLWNTHLYALLSVTRSTGPRILSSTCRVCVIVELPVCACAGANMCACVRACVRASGREHCFLRVFVFIHDTVNLLDVHLIEHFQLVFCDLSIVMEPSYCEVIYNANTTTKECTWIPLHRMIHGRRH